MIDRGWKASLGKIKNSDINLNSQVTIHIDFGVGDVVPLHIHNLYRKF